jgi:lipopolysaccharide export LptBFGC system permease protein LptF
MKTLDRYVIRSFLLSALLWFLILMSMRVVIDLLVNMDEFAEGGRPIGEVLSHIATYYSYHSLVYFVELGGLILVAAAAFTLARMNHTNELTAILASGVSLYRVVLPMVLSAVILSGLIVADRELLISRFAPKLARSIDDMAEESSSAFEVRLITDGNQAVWFSRHFQPDRNSLEEPVAMIRDKRARMTHCMSGSQALWDTDADRGWLFRDPTLSATRAWPASQGARRIHTTLPPDQLAENIRAGQPLLDPVYNMAIQADRFTRSEDGRRIVLAGPTFTFRGPANRRRVVFYATSAEWKPAVGAAERSYWLLDQPYALVLTDLSPEDITLRQDRRWMEWLSTPELGRLLETRRLPNRRAVRMTRQTRFAEPFVNILMLLLALPFILSRERNIKTSVGMCIGILTVFIAFVYACRFLGLPPALAAWLPVMVFTPIALVTVDSVKT